MPVSGGVCLKKRSRASRPPADAPNAAITNRLDGASSPMSISPSAFAESGDTIPLDCGAAGRDVFFAIVYALLKIRAGRSRSMITLCNEATLFPSAGMRCADVVLADLPDVEAELSVGHRSAIFNALSGRRAPSRVIFDAASSIAWRLAAVSSTASDPRFSSDGGNLVAAGMGRSRAFRQPTTQGQSALASRLSSPQPPGDRVRPCWL
jgi:hypothetical protein